MSRIQSDEETLKRLKVLLPRRDPFVANARGSVEDGGMTALLVAISSGLGAVVIDYLVAKGADLTAWDGCAWTALHWAARKNHPHAAAKALDAGVSVEVLCSPGGPGGEMTPLMVACRYQAVDVIRVLMARGADPKWVHANGTSILEHARNELELAIDARHHEATMPHPSDVPHPSGHALSASLDDHLERAQKVLQLMKQEVEEGTIVEYAQVYIED